VPESVMSWPLVRPSLDDLLREHRGIISALRRSLAVEVEAQVDDVWLLRYALSFKDDLPAAIQAAKAAITWRRENSNLVQAAAAREAPSELTEQELAAIHQCFVAAYYCCTRFGDPVFISRLCAYNVNHLMEVVSEAKLELWFNFVNECAWQYCEAETLQRRYFVMQINIQDVHGVKMMQNRSFLRALGNSSKVNDWLRPQLFGKTYILNPPRWLSMASRLAGGLMSKKSLEKVWVHPTKVGEGRGLCFFAQQLFDADTALPKFLGGNGDADEVFPMAPRAAAVVQRSALPILAGLPVQAATVSFSEHWREDVDSYLSGKQEDYVIYDRDGHDVALVEETVSRDRFPLQIRRQDTMLSSSAFFSSSAFASAVGTRSMEGSKQGSQMAMSMCSAVTALEFPVQEPPRRSWCRRVCAFFGRREAPLLR